MAASDWIALLAIVVSIGSVVFQLIWEKTQNSKDNITAIYKEVYKQIFLEELPIAREKIKYNGTKLTGQEDMERIMSDIRRKAYFFESIDCDFKEKIINQSQIIEDFLVKSEDKIITDEEYRKNYQKLEEELKHLYDFVMKRFF